MKKEIFTKYWKHLLIILFISPINVAAQKTKKKSQHRNHSTEAPFYDQRWETPTIDNTAENNDFFYFHVDEKPTFEECKDKINQTECFHEQLDLHIKRIINEYNINTFQSGVKMALRINKNGNIEVISMKGENKSHEKEARRVIQLLPKLIPAKNNGENVNVIYSYHINFENKNNNNK